ncbi:MAG TPA: FtsX-like permease family protein, partial [Candidatus Sulfomarinibacteraceae bacterium]|nr:FtsX-like permease family protein [Candidatus Sulfomarinibacteraceae bacterium]
ASAARTPGVAAASASFSVGVQVEGHDGRWQDLTITARPGWHVLPVNQIWPQQGAWPPPAGSIVLERNALPLLGAQIGDTVRVDLGDGRLRDVQIAGTVHDINSPPARFVDQLSGYAGFDTLARWGYGRQFNSLLLTAADQQASRAGVETVAQAVQDKIEKAGGRVFSRWVPEPGQTPVQTILDALFVILGVLGALSLLLSGFLVVNTVNATLAQQTRQVGVMKAIGARSRQIMGLYFGMALVYGLLALLIGLPLGLLGALGLARFAAGFLNFDVAGPGFAPQVLAMQIAVALLLPLLASAIPVWLGARITVREAMASYGLGKGRFGRGPVDHLLLLVQRALPLRRPLVISLRNTFRRKGRLALTMITLTLGGAIFVGVFSVRDSLYNTLALANRYDNFDVAVELSRPYRTQQIEAAALDVPGVVTVETWGSGGALRLRPNGSESDRIRVRAPEAGTQMIQPRLLAGRWLLPDDQSAVVLNSSVLDDEPDLRVGDTVTLRLAGKESDWTVVGIVQSILTQPTAYVNYPFFAQYTGATGRANFARVATEQHSPAAQAAAAAALQTHLEEAGFQVSRVETKFQRQESIRLQFDILITFLLVMALLIAAVGGMGLMGTMSINVLERTREIGVMRAIGAATGSIMQIVIVEGVLIGLISWTQGVLLGWPIGRLMSDRIGLAFVDSPLEFQYSINGALLWLAAALLISAIASFWPAHNAASLSVREVLAYE